MFVARGYPLRPSALLALCSLIVIAACADPGGDPSENSKWQCADRESLCECVLFRPGFGFNPVVVHEADLRDRCEPRACCVYSAVATESTLEGCACYDAMSDCEKEMAEGMSVDDVDSCPPSSSRGAQK